MTNSPADVIAFSPTLASGLMRSQQLQGHPPRPSLSPVYSDNMSSPPNTNHSGTSPRADPPRHQPLFISYVTGTRPGTGQWTTRVSRQVADSTVVRRVNSGNHPEAANSGNVRTGAEGGQETAYADQDRRRITLPLPLSPPVPMSSRYSATSARERAAAEKVTAREGGDAKVVITREELGLESRPTLRHLWERAGTPSKLGDGRLTEEQIFKGLVVDYLSHERFPNTVGVLLGASPSADQEIDGKGKAREELETRQDDDDVHMMSASTTFTSTRPHKPQMEKENGKLDAEAFVKQIERRKEIREMIISGRITAATELLRRDFPSLLDTSRDEYVNPYDGEDDDDMEDEEDDLVAAEWAAKKGSRTNGKNGNVPDSALPVTNSRAHVRTTHVSGNAARGGAGSRFGIMTRPSGNGTTTTEHAEDVRWTAHPRSTNKVSTFTVPDTLELTVPDFPFAHTYDRPTLLALNLDIQEFVEGLRVLQQQVPSSPSEAVSLSNSMYDESTKPPDVPLDIGMASRPTTPNPTAVAATRKAARDAAILACLAHAARLDNATRRLRPREARKYAQQVQDVCGLLAYTDMEASPLAGYLEQERRQRLADMVEGCILACLGYPPQSLLESLWQQDAYLWHPEYGHLAMNEIKFEDAEDGQYKKMKELAMDLLYMNP